MFGGEVADGEAGVRMEGKGRGRERDGGKNERERERGERGRQFCDNRVFLLGAGVCFSLCVCMYV